jgi:hypothetical protein
MAIVLLALLVLAACSQEQEQTGNEQPVPVPETGTAIAFIAQQGEEGNVTPTSGQTDRVAEEPGSTRIAENTGSTHAAETSGSTRAAAPHSTRAEKGLETVLLTDDKLFKVWAFKNAADGGAYANYQTVMNGYTVRWEENSAATTTTNTHNWEYVNQQGYNEEEQTVKYWDWNTGAYRFFAYAETGTSPNSKMTVTTDLVSTSSTVTFTLDADATNPDAAPYFSRLWFSTPDDEKFGKAVTLEFLKPFAKVRFMFRLSDPTADVVLEEKYFKPTDANKKICRKGDFKVTYPLKGATTQESFTIDTSNAEWLAALTEDYEPNNAEKVYTLTDNGWYTVLPAINQGSYTLDVHVNGYLQTAVVPAEYMNWKPGYAYTYIFKITEEHSVEIDLVQSAFTGWEMVSPTAHTVYNW